MYRESSRTLCMIQAVVLHWLRSNLTIAITIERSKSSSLPVKVCTLVNIFIVEQKPDLPLETFYQSTKFQKVPSGHRKTIVGQSRAMLGIVAGGGRNEKPILK